MGEWLMLVALCLTRDKAGLVRGIEWLFGWDQDPESIEALERV